MEELVGASVGSVGSGFSVVVETGDGVVAVVSFDGVTEAMVVVVDG